MMFFLIADHFSFDVSCLSSTATLEDEKKPKEGGSEKPPFITANSFLGHMKGVLINIGYVRHFQSFKHFFRQSFQESSQKFLEWDFFHLAGGLGAKYFGAAARNTQALTVSQYNQNHLTYKNHAKGVEFTFSQVKLGGFVSDKISFYGVFSPMTFMTGEVEGAFGTYNLGLIAGVGMQYFFHKRWGIQSELTVTKAYFSNISPELVELESTFVSKLAFQRFSIGLCYRAKN